MNMNIMNIMNIDLDIWIKCDGFLVTNYDWTDNVSSDER